MEQQLRDLVRALATVNGHPSPDEYVAQVEQALELSAPAAPAGEDTGTGS